MLNIFFVLSNRSLALKPNRLKGGWQKWALTDEWKERGISLQEDFVIYLPD